MAQLAKINRREQVGDAEPLPHIALADDLRHVEHMAPHRMGALLDLPEVGDGRQGFHWSSCPPVKLNRSPVT